MSAERNHADALRRGLDELPSLLRPDGTIIIPAAVAGDVLRLLVLGLTVRVRADGGELGPTARRVLWALHEAAQRTEQTGFADETSAPAPATVEIRTAQEMAVVMGCSVQYVRRLCASGALHARRAGRSWLITDDRRIRQ